MSSNAKVSISGERTFHIDRVDCTVDLGKDFLTGTENDSFKGVIVKASFHDVTEQGTANGRLVWTDNPIIQKYIDDLPADQFTSDDEDFYEAFIEAVTDMCNSVGPGITVGPNYFGFWDESVEGEITAARLGKPE